MFAECTEILLLKICLALFSLTYLVIGVFHTMEYNQRLNTYISVFMFYGLRFTIKLARMASLLSHDSYNS